jgi:hypothetical protein
VSGTHALIGSMISNLTDLVESKEYELKDKKNKISGKLKVDKYQIIKIPNFLNYLYDGLQISLLLSIDFTGSNGIFYFI